MDSFWNSLVADARAAAGSNPFARPAIRRMLGAGAAAGLARLVAVTLGGNMIERGFRARAFAARLEQDEEALLDARRDLEAVMAFDPACRMPYQAALHYKGFHALLAYRIAHGWWKSGEMESARHLNYLASLRFGVDIHPGARLAGGIFLDHGTGIVIGETAAVEEGSILMQGVTLGGTGKERGDRHPKLGKGVYVGAGAKLLGNIRIGPGARIGAGSVVLRDVPNGATVVGVPGRIVREPVHSGRSSSGSGQSSR